MPLWQNLARLGGRHVRFGARGQARAYPARALADSPTPMTRSTLRSPPFTAGPRTFQPRSAVRPRAVRGAARGGCARGDAAQSADAGILRWQTASRQQTEVERHSRSRRGNFGPWTRRLWSKTLDRIRPQQPTQRAKKEAARRRPLLRPISETYATGLAVRRQR
jgi:hypothetical protein